MKRYRPTQKELELLQAQDVRDGEPLTTAEELEAANIVSDYMHARKTAPQDPEQWLALASTEEVRELLRQYMDDLHVTEPLLSRGWPA
jgi:hypothetical protein